MAKVKIEVLGAVIDGKGKGEIVEVEERSAKHFEKIGYAHIQKPVKASSEKGQSAPKKDGSKTGGKTSTKQKASAKTSGK